MIKSTSGIWIAPLIIGLLMAVGLTAQEMSPADRATRILDLMRRGRSVEVVAEFNAAMSAALSADRLSEVWAGLQMQAGAFTSVIDASVTGNPPMTIATLGLQFEFTALNMVAAFDGENRIAGLRFLPRPAPGAVTTPASARFTENSVTVGSGEWTLPGTVSLPVGNNTVAGVVLVHGSGPYDRDLTIGPNKIFRDIAWALADAGIAVLRYEKRTQQHPAQFARIRNFTVREETVDDAVLAVAALRSEERVDDHRVFVLGHSLGGMLAPRIAERDPGIAGLMILAGNTRPLPELVVEQMQHLGLLNGGLVAPDMALEALKREAARVMDPALSLNTPASELLLQLPASYWRDLSSYKPAETASRLRMPMLILQGERDYQVTLTDLQGWRAALGQRGDVRIKSYPGLNHLFMPGEGKSTPQEYARPNQIPGNVIADIIDWLRSTSAQPR
jgi:dienelactone hydrolase